MNAPVRIHITFDAVVLEAALSPLDAMFRETALLACELAEAKSEAERFERECADIGNALAHDLLYGDDELDDGDDYDVESCMFCHAPAGECGCETEGLPMQPEA